MTVIEREKQDRWMESEIESEKGKCRQDTWREGGREGGRESGVVGGEKELEGRKRELDKISAETRPTERTQPIESLHYT